MSRSDWGIPGKRCFRISSIVSALSSRSSLFSILTPEPHEDLVSFALIFLFQITTDASILFLRSSILCSVDKSREESRQSGSKKSSVMLLYIWSPRLALPFYLSIQKKVDKYIKQYYESNKVLRFYRTLGRDSM